MMLVCSSLLVHFICKKRHNAIATHAQGRSQIVHVTTSHFMVTSQSTRISNKLLRHN